MVFTTRATKVAHFTRFLQIMLARTLSSIPALTLCEISAWPLGPVLGLNAGFLVQPDGLDVPCEPGGPHGFG